MTPNPTNQQVALLVAALTLPKEHVAPAEIPRVVRENATKYLDWLENV